MASAKQSDLIIIEGKFFRDGKPVQTEIGNQEQINALRNAEERVSELTKGMEVDPEYETVVNASINFKCVCGKTINCEWEDVEEGENRQFVRSLNKPECYACHRKYKFDEDDDFNLIVKLA